MENGRERERERVREREREREIRNIPCALRSSWTFLPGTATPDTRVVGGFLELFLKDTLFLWTAGATAATRT